MVPIAVSQILASSVVPAIEKLAVEPHGTEPTALSASTANHVADGAASTAIQNDPMHEAPPPKCSAVNNVFDPESAPPPPPPEIDFATQISTGQAPNTGAAKVESMLKESVLYLFCQTFAVRACSGR